MHEPYNQADRAIQLLNRKAVLRFQRAKSAMQQAGFDELNVLSACRELYAGLEQDNSSAFLELCQLVYEEARPHGQQEPDWPLILAWLDQYDPVTKYVYTHEVERKRAYAQEAVLSSKTPADKVRQLEKALRLWAGMTGQYCDNLTDRTILTAYQDAGVRYVMWRTEEDERVCPVCKPLDGNIYPIAKAPLKQHWRCRCFLIPVTRSGRPWGL